MFTLGAIEANTGIFRQYVSVVFTNGLMRPNDFLLFSETVPGFPDVVGMLDCTCLRINRPTGPNQQFFYRGDKGYHFMNWLVVVDAAGYFVHTSCGYTGHNTDATCLRLSHGIGPGQPLLLRQNHKLMADGAFPVGPNILTPVPPRQQPPDVRIEMNRKFSSERVKVEHRIGDLRTYKVVANDSKFRGKRSFLPYVANTVMALVNRRRRIIMSTRIIL